jgi:RND family efflux transporter MFP subunit
VETEAERVGHEQALTQQTADAASPDTEAYAYLEQTLWTQLGDAVSKEAFASAWLKIQCKMTRIATHGVVVLGAAEKGPFLPVAYWPEDAEVSLELSAVAEMAMAERKGSVRTKKAREGSQADSHDFVAYPLLVDGQLHGVVAMQLERSTELQLRAVMRQLQWGCAGLEALIRRKVITSKDRLVAVLELVAVCLEHEHFQGAATALVTELANLLHCEWVSIGFLQGRRTRVRAFSHSAEFDKKTNLIRSIGMAMDEALDQQTSIIYPPLSDTPAQATQAHAELDRQSGGGSLCTIPLSESGRLIGGIMLHRLGEEPFSPEDIEFCKHVGSLIGPLLDTKRKEDRWLLAKTWDAGHRLLGKLIGPRHLGLKIAFVLLLGLSLFLVIAEGDYRITADASLEGTVQRAMTAQLAGYIAEANVRAGDIVRQGDLLCALENKDLHLERVKWVSQREQKLREYSNALAEGERAKVRILGAQVDQAKTQIALLDKQLARTRIIAPFDGVVVSGDLSQSLSAPVERGQVLFEIAPLDSYRVVLKIDERDVSQIKVGQQGQLALAGLPGQTLPIMMQQITPVSIAEEGRNYFRAEAQLEQLTEALRPGMEGVGKIRVDRRKLIWIWTHKLMYWVRLWAWSWWP